MKIEENLNRDGRDRAEMLRVRVLLSGNPNPASPDRCFRRARIPNSFLLVAPDKAKNIGRLKENDLLKVTLGVLDFLEQHRIQ